jgi:hypothetical protein
MIYGLFASAKSSLQMSYAQNRHYKRFMSGREKSPGDWPGLSLALVSILVD